MSDAYSGPSFNVWYKLYCRPSPYTNYSQIFNPTDIHFGSSPSSVKQSVGICRHRDNSPWERPLHSVRWNIPRWLVLQGHWGSTHEGSGRHSRQYGGGRGRRFGKFTAISRRVCSLLWPSFWELIVIVMGHIDAESRAAVIRYLTAIPA